MKIVLTKYFWFSLLILITLSVYRYLSTLSNVGPAIDGCVASGFPFTFYKFCAFGGVYTNYLNLFFDIITIICLPLTINFIVLKAKKD